MNNSDNNNIVVEVKDVHKSFKDVHAVNGVNLKIHKGQFVALLGPNGAGKTTLVEMIEGIQQPDSGVISIMGKNWDGNEDEIHQVIGLSLQETRFMDKLTVKETLELFASLYPNIKNISERVAEVTGLIGLSEKADTYTVNLSGGQRQKLALGISLLNSPKVLLLDEPTTGLDPNARREIWAILLKLKQEAQTSLILTTHYMEEAEQLCEYIIIIDKGKILLEGQRDELLNKDDEKIIEFTLETNRKDISFSDSIGKHKIEWDQQNNKGMVILNDLETELPDFLSYLKQHNLPLKNFESRKKTLDDLFTSLTGRHLHEEND